MILINRTPLRFYNHTHQIVFHHIAWERLNFHQVCVFPWNILVLVPEASGKQEDYVECRISGEHLPLKKDHFYLIPCGLPAEYRLTEEITFLTFHFNLELFPGMDLFSGRGRCLTGFSPEMTSHFRSLFDDSNAHRSVCRFQSALMDFCVRHWPEDHELRIERSTAYESLFQYIRENLNAKLSVADLADRCRMSKEAFSRRFHQDLGETPKQFLQRLLLRRAMLLLAAPDSSVKETADKLDFSSEFYLSRFFRKQTGMPPGEFRKKVRRLTLPPECSASKDEHEKNAQPPPGEPPPHRLLTSRH